MLHTTDYYVESAQSIWLHLNGFVPKVAMILGSGLGFLADQVENPITVPY